MHPREMSNREISDRIRIQDLLTRYTVAIDTKNWELLDTCFTPDAHVDYTTSGGTKGPYPEVRSWLQKALAPFRDQDPDARRWRDPQTHRRCAEELAECQTLMDGIMLEEKKSEMEMVRRRDETARQLHGAHQAGRARGAYATQSQSAPPRIDLSSELH